MLATLPPGEPEPDLANPSRIYEPKYDGIRVLAFIEPGSPAPSITLRSRQGNDKTAQFPDVVRALKAFGKPFRAPILLDGELVALDEHGEPVGFQHLQGRIHLTARHDIEAMSGTTPVALFAFDLLRDGQEDLRPLPLAARKARLERAFGNRASALVRMSESSAGDGTALYRRAQALGWEGLIAKDAASTYESGRRSPAWRKLKLVKRQELVVGGWTEPRGSRQYFGSLVLGYYEERATGPALRFAGLAGTGFDARALERIWRLLKAREVPTSPFAERVKTPEPAHWTRPELVAEVKFTEWTRDDLLRHPVFLGLRDDKDPRSIRREPQPDLSARRGTSSAAPRATATRARGAAAVRQLSSKPLARLVERLEELEDAKRDGVLELPDGTRVEVTNLAKVFWPQGRFTKGDLMRYYARISPWLLPAVADRPLVMKRFPNGVAGKAFYQQRAPAVPPCVRTVDLHDDEEPMPRIVGGTLATLIYTTQIAAISQDPWFSRVQSPGEADYVAIDLDPMPGVPFTQVLEVARLVREELDRARVTAYPKTSGSSGLHIYIPLVAGTGYEAGQVFCQIVATMVATRAPRIATVERAVRKRGRTVYVDYLQNIQGKTLATAYSARASDFAGVSTPLAWDEIDADVRPQDFTLANAFERFRAVGDLWAPMHGRRRNDLRDALDRLAGGS
jgi:bifunctional non-homologous end joining protein LigD